MAYVGGEGSYLPIAVVSIYTNVRIENLDSVGYLVSAGEERGRHTEAELLRGFEIDCQQNFGCLLDGQVTWLGATENLIDVLRPARVGPTFILAVDERKSDPWSKPCFEYPNENYARGSLDFFVCAAA